MIATVTERQPRSREVTGVLAAPPEVVYELVSDVVATAAFSEEIANLHWVSRRRDDVVSVGDRFTAENSTRGMSWTSTSVVTAAEDGRRFAFAVSDVENPTATWTFALESHPGGTEVRYRVELGDGPSMFDRATGGDPTRRAGAETVRLDALAEGMAHLLDTLSRQAR